MIDEKTNGCSFQAVLYDVRVKRDGGGRLQLDFGADSLVAIQHLQQLSASGDVVLQIGVVPVPRGVLGSERGGEYEPDETGEINLTDG